MPDNPPVRHGVVVLAAGRSLRLGRAKQLLHLDGESLVHRMTRFGLDTGPGGCVVVCAEVPDAVSAAVADLDCRCIPCTGAGQGLSESLRCGVRALSRSCSAALVLLTDQPGVDMAHLRALLETWQGDPRQAAASGYAGRVGVPAVIPRAWFAALMEISGDIGARELLRARSAEVSVIAADHLQRDIDHPSDLDEAFRSS
jgi:CTP:molybdopterin cytidylyltransferase MocA